MKCTLPSVAGGQNALLKENKYHDNAKNAKNSQNKRDFASTGKVHKKFLAARTDLD